MPPPFGSSSTNVNININGNVNIVNNSVNINSSHAGAHGGMAGAGMMGGMAGGGALAIQRGSMGFQGAMAGGGAMHMGTAHAGMIAGAAGGGYSYGYHGGMHAGGAMMAAGMAAGARGGDCGYSCRGGMRAGGATMAAGMHGGAYYAGWYGFRQSWAQHFHWMDYGVYDSRYQWQMTLRAMSHAVEASQQRSMLTGILRRSRAGMTKAKIEALAERILHSNRLIGAGNDGRVSEIIETTTTTTTIVTQEQRFEAANEFINTLQRDSGLHLTVEQAKQVSDSLRNGKKDDLVRTYLEQKQARTNMPQTNQMTSQQLQLEAPRTPTPMPWQQRTSTPAVQSSYASVHRAEQNRQDSPMSQQQGSTTATTTSFMTVTQAQRLEAANAFANNLQSKGGMGLNAEQGKQIAQAILSGQKDDMVRKIVEEKKTLTVSHVTQVPQQNVQIQTPPAPAPGFQQAQQCGQDSSSHQQQQSSTTTTTITTTQQHHQAMMGMMGDMQVLSVQSGQFQSPQPVQQMQSPQPQQSLQSPPVAGADDLRPCADACIAATSVHGDQQQPATAPAEHVWSAATAAGSNAGSGSSGDTNSITTTKHADGSSVPKKHRKPAAANASLRAKHAQHRTGSAVVSTADTGLAAAGSVATTAGAVTTKLSLHYGSNAAAAAAAVTGLELRRNASYASWDLLAAESAATIRAGSCDSTASSLSSTSHSDQYNGSEFDSMAAARTIHAKPAARWCWLSFRPAASASNAADKLDSPYS